MPLVSIGVARASATPLFPTLPLACLEAQWPCWCSDDPHRNFLVWYVLFPTSSVWRQWRSAQQRGNRHGWPLLRDHLFVTNRSRPPQDVPPYTFTDMEWPGRAVDAACRQELEALYATLCQAPGQRWTRFLMTEPVPWLPHRRLRRDWLVYVPRDGACSRTTNNHLASWQQTYQPAIINWTTRSFHDWPPATKESHLCLP